MRERDIYLFAIIQIYSVLDLDLVGLMMALISIRNADVYVDVLTLQLCNSNCGLNLTRLEENDI